MPRRTRTTALTLAAITLTLAGCASTEPQLEVHEPTEDGFMVTVANTTGATEDFTVILLEDQRQSGHRELGSLGPGERTDVYIRTSVRTSTSPDTVRLDTTEDQGVATAQVTVR